MADSSQEEKQNFLREKILEKGYDTNQFVQFLIDKKGEDGADVSVWTMNDLKIVVKEFIKLNGGQVEEEPPKPQPKQEPKTKKISMFDVLGESKPKPQPQPQQTQSQKPKTETTKVEQKQQQQNIEQKPKNEHVSNTTSNPAPNSSNNTLNKQNSLTLSGNESDYGVIIADTKKCKPCETTDIAKSQNVSISLSKPEKKKGGFLAKDYITYLINYIAYYFLNTIIIQVILSHPTPVSLYKSLATILSNISSTIFEIFILGFSFNFLLTKSQAS